MYPLLYVNPKIDCVATDTSGSERFDRVGSREIVLKQ